jgi:ATP-binding cassette subfamily B multidrug efflux pump
VESSDPPRGAEFGVNPLSTARITYTVVGSWPHVILSEFARRAEPSVLRPLISTAQGRRRFVFSRGYSPLGPRTIDRSSHVQNMKLLIPYAMRHRARILIGLLCIAIGTAAALYQPYYLNQATNIIRTYDQRGHSLAGLKGLVFLFMGTAIVQAVMAFFQRSTINRVSRYMEFDLRQDLFLHLQKQDQGFFQSMHTGDLMARLTNDVNAVRQFIGMGVISFIQFVMMLLGAGVWLFIISWKLALITFVLLPMTSMGMILIGRRMQARYRAVQDQYGAVSTFAQESFSGIRVIKAYVQEHLEADAFGRQNEEYVGRSLRFARLSASLWPLMMYVVGLTSAIVLYFGGQEVIHGQIQVGQLVQFMFTIQLLTFPMISLGWTMNMYQQASASMERISEIFHRHPRIKDSSGHTVPITTLEGDIEFENVGVSYGDQRVISDVSFKVPHGSTTAIVGRTGAGKSTLVSLIPRILEADEGRVLIDGVDVRRIPLDLLRRSVGYASQDTFLFSTTLRENVGFGVASLHGEGASEEILHHAIEVSRLSKDLEQFPAGLNTIIGERGVSLSGGQKQRTSLARAVARDPVILILDDAMSSVDTQTQSEILFRIKKVMENRTSLIISQRVSTIKDADEIIVLDQGRVVERGDHMTLLNQNGTYARMYKRELLQQELEVEPEVLTAEGVN